MGRPALTPNLKGRDIAEAFKGDEYQLLLVANEFQTGFDQPLLCGMYVDRRLAGFQGVQTLSRLNRAYSGEDTTYVLDFVNCADEVLTAFRTYCDTAELAGTTDPNLIYDLRAKLDAASHDDQLIYVNNVIKGKLLESPELVLQAQNNTKAQFANSPTLTTEIMNAVMDALAAHETMSKQALGSESVRDGLKDVLLGPGQLYEALRERGGVVA